MTDTLKRLLEILSLIGVAVLGIATIAVAFILSLAPIILMLAASLYLIHLIGWL